MRGGDCGYAYRLRLMMILFSSTNKKQVTMAMTKLRASACETNESMRVWAVHDGGEKLNPPPRRVPRLIKNEAVGDAEYQRPQCYTHRQFCGVREAGEQGQRTERRCEVKGPSSKERRDEAHEQTREQRTYRNHCYMGGRHQRLRGRREAYRSSRRQREALATWAPHSPPSPQQCHGSR